MPATNQGEEIESLLVKHGCNGLAEDWRSGDRDKQKTIFALLLLWGWVAEELREYA